MRAVSPVPRLPVAGSSLPWRDGRYRYPNHRWAALKSVSQHCEKKIKKNKGHLPLEQTYGHTRAHSGSSRQRVDCKQISQAQLPAKTNFNIRLVVTLVLLAGLLLEPQSLVEGVVQLGVRVRNLLLADECPIKQSVSWTQKHHAAVRRHTQISRRDLFISG